MSEKVIKHEKALKDLQGIYDVLVGAGDPFLANVMLRAINCIKNQDVFDAEKVVYCEDCLYRSQYPDKTGHYKCGVWSEDEHQWFVSPTFYCKAGEKQPRSSYPEFERRFMGRWVCGIDLAEGSDSDGSQNVQSEG